jgi:replicative DNA helicase
MNDPYYSESDELGVLGCCFRGDLTILSDIAASFQPVMLVNDPVRDSYELSLILLAENQRTTTASMERLWARTHENRPAPKEVWSKAMSAIPSASNHPFYVQGIKESFRRRVLRDAALKLAHETSDLSKTTESMVADLEAGIAAESDEAVVTTPGKAAMIDYIQDLRTRFDRKGQLSGIPTGFWRLDSMTDGMQFAELFILGARPSIGKTAIAVNIVRHACIEKGWPTLVVTCEMSKNALIRRMMSDLASVPLQDQKKGELNEGQFKKLLEKGKVISDSKIFFHDASRGETIDAIVAAIRSNVRRFGIKLVVVDYLQKIMPGTRHEKRTYEVGEVSMKLKAVAASTGVALLCLAQLNRDTEKEKGRPPRLGDLGDSKQIEQDADVVALLDRKRGEKEGEATLAIAKQRDGECGLIPLNFQGQFCRFSTRGPEID